MQKILKSTLHHHWSQPATPESHKALTKHLVVLGEDCVMPLFSFARQRFFAHNVEGLRQRRERKVLVKSLQRCFSF
jgi:hypothetical protein